jgi:hypothetical protein
MKDTQHLSPDLTPEEQQIVRSHWEWAGRYALFWIIVTILIFGALFAALDYGNASQELWHAGNIHDPREIVREHVQGHFGSYLGQAFHQKVCCAHSHLERRERMLSPLAADTHRLRV